jgi:hypothetical protein
MSSKLREALKDAKRTLGRWREDLPVSAWEEVDTTILEIQTALAEPLRNCDVGTAEEQYARFVDFCWRYRTVSVGGNSSCNDCPIKGRKVCQLAWAQMPYEKEGEQ